MVIGQSGKSEDVEVNVCKTKKLTNTRSSSADEALKLVPPRVMSLEQCLEFIDTDELLEVTPENFRGIAALMLADLVSILEKKGIDASFTEAARDYVAEKSYSAKYGARNMRRFIQTEIEDKVGNLNSLLKTLLEMNINVYYLYLSFDRKSGLPIMVFSTDDIWEVEEGLRGKGYKVVEESAMS